MNKITLSLSKGFYLENLNISLRITESIKKSDWNIVDEEFRKLTSPGGEIFARLVNKISFTHIETMLSIRDADDAWQEDGIWHDDGSRVLAFSLSLSIEHDKIEGGYLGLRRKGEIQCEMIPTPPFGTAIIFLTGVHGYEHKIHQVTKGKRIVLVGWCS